MTETRTLLDVAESQPAQQTSVSRAAGVSRSRKEDALHGLEVERVFTRKGVHPFDEIEWEVRKASITDDKGKALFALNNAEIPKPWSMLAANVVASKYFYGATGTDVRETSARRLIHRVARTIADWGLQDGSFASAEDAENFYNEIAYVCVNQYGSFNSPVWFNVGLNQVYGLSSSSRTSHHWNTAKNEMEQCRDSYKHPQASACFIQSVSDTMEDIMRLAASEAMLFKYGSGTGTDLSTLRSSREKLSGGGTPSGPLSFMRVFDQVAAVVKSGGKTRRAAKMQSLRVDHPDIVEFVTAKMKEEKKAWTLIDAGYDGSFGGDAYSSVMFQNSNFSVRLTDEFMQAVENDGDWQTIAVTTGKVVETLKARDLMRLIAEGTHVCGDPGVQYDTTVNRWHTCLQSGRINASNPCSEYMFVDNSACNLASINLIKFLDDGGGFDTRRFRHVVRLFIIAQEILVDSASYPTVEICRNSHLFRPLGLGYANLGAVIMALGYPYDSEEGRALAAVVSALMTGYAYETSSHIAAAKGTFEEFPKNRDFMLNVIRMHRDGLVRINERQCPPALFQAAEKVWDRIIKDAIRHGFRNAQVTLLAPTGTIGFMMDCDTTGVEPDMALVKYKQLAGGGMMKIVNRTVSQGLKRLGYGGAEIEAINRYIDEKETIEGAPGLKPEHLPVFDCAFKPKDGIRCIPYQAHLKMMAAVQPFLSGAISKTINMPTETTVDEIMQAYMDGWRMGLKAVAIYRDGSKRTQPVTTSKEGPKKEAGAPAAAGGAAPGHKAFRKRMPATRQSITHKFEVAGHEGYLTVGLHPDGSPGELFITMAKEGSTVGGIMDAFGTAISLCLQYGATLRELVRKFSHSRFEPAGYTKNPDIPMAKSLVDYIFRWLDLTFPDGRVNGAPPVQREAGPPKPEKAEKPEKPVKSVGLAKAAKAASVQEDIWDDMRVDEQFEHYQTDAPACDVCGAITVRNGHCYRCFNCGHSMGCS